MNLAEKILVVLDEEICYNLHVGGIGGKDPFEKYSKEEKQKWARQGRIATDSILRNKYGENFNSVIGKLWNTTELRLKQKARKIEKNLSKVNLEEIYKIDFSIRGWTKELNKHLNYKNDARSAPWLKYNLYEIWKTSWPRNLQR